jgi:hypothetical protein
MSNTKKIIELLTTNKNQLLIAIINAIVLALGTYITIRLAPLYQDIALIKKDIDANAKMITVLSEKKADKEKIELYLESIDKRLTRIENKLDR